MNPLRFWFAIFAIFGWVLVAPAWVWVATTGLTGVPTVVEWLVALMLPAALMVTLASWVQGGS